MKTSGYAALSSSSPLVPFTFERRDPWPQDVQIEILYCGICHSDLHVVKNEWKGTVYPVVPGHEIVGRVTKIGNEVKGFKEGDFAAVGCLVNSCRRCGSCREDLEQFCEKGFTMTFNSLDPDSGEMTHGGFSTQIVVDQRFVLQIPKQFKERDLAAVAPLLCAGITTYSPLRHWKVGKGSRVGIVGLGGLGHLGVKIAHAMGAHVVVFTTSANKASEAKKLGADEVVLSKNSEEMLREAHRFDFILNTVAVPHDLNAFLELLKRDCTMCLVGLPSQPHPLLRSALLITGRRSLAGSLIGGIKETQEMLNFCAEHQIFAEIELIPIQKINEAFERLIKNDVKYRFVIDLASLRS